MKTENDMLYFKNPAGEEQPITDFPESAAPAVLKRAFIDACGLFRVPPRLHYIALKDIREGDPSLKFVGEIACKVNNVVYVVESDSPGGSIKAVSHCAQGFNVVMCSVIYLPDSSSFLEALKEYIRMNSPYQKDDAKAKVAWIEVEEAYKEEKE